MSNYIRSEQEEVKDYASRYILLYSVIGIAATVIFARLWYLQIIAGQELREYSEKNRIKETKIPAPRGLILDRNGQVLVENLRGFVATISPQYATKLKETAKEIAPVLEMEDSKIISMVKTSRSRNGPFRPVVIKDNLSLDEVSKLKILRIDNPGLNVIQTIVRHYPLGEVGAQLLGYVREISKSQISRYNKKYKGKLRFEQGDIIGKAGLEEFWETTLKGRDGIQYVEVDARGREAISETPSFLGLKTQSAIPGTNLVLTIDKDLQKAAVQAMTGRKDKYGKRIGSLLAIDNKGEILSWISLPSYNPNNFSVNLTTELWSQLSNDPFKPLLNKVVQDHSSPGSSFKPIVALAALQEKVITENTKIHSPGVMKYAGRPYHDSHREGHGTINVVRAIEASSNVFFYKMGVSLGIDRIAQYATLLGMGSQTKVKINNELSGLIPTKEWKLSRFGEEWQGGENLSNAIGQGFVLTTAIQLAVAYNTIALEGKMYRPQLVKRLVDHQNKVVKEFPPTLVRDVSKPNPSGIFIEKENFKIVKKGLWNVANGSHGTAKWHKIPGVKFAGKTGTVQLKSFAADQIYQKCTDLPIKQRHHGWFVGYIPADDPQVTIVVFAEHGCSSGAAVGVFRDFAEKYIEKYHPEKLRRKRARNKVPVAKKTQVKEAPAKASPKTTPEDVPTKDVPVKAKETEA